MQYEPFFTDIAVLADNLRDRLVVHRFVATGDEARLLNGLILHVEAIQKRLEKAAKMLVPTETHGD